MKREGEVGPRPDVRGPRSEVRSSPRKLFHTLCHKPRFLFDQTGRFGGQWQGGHRTSDIGHRTNPRCITGIEITAGQDQQPDIKLIKWAYSAQSESQLASSHTQDDFNLVVKRSVLEPSLL